MSPFDDGGINANARNVAVTGESAFHSVNSYVTCWLGSLEQSHTNYLFFFIRMPLEIVTLDCYWKGLGKKKYVANI